jgi:hypothetical protein
MQGQKGDREDPEIAQFHHLPQSFIQRAPSGWIDGNSPITQSKDRA